MSIIRSLLARLYLPIVTRAHPEPVGEERQVTILFSDLQDYSTVCECLPPLDVMTMLNHYLAVMSAVVEQYHGHVIEFTGDGLVAVFGAPMRRTDHAAQAVRCAIAMQRQLQHLNQAWRRTGLTQAWRERRSELMSARIGIHCGAAVVGRLGSPLRRKYTVVGSVVNVAARLEALNKRLRTAILLSADVCGQLPAAIADDFIDQGEFHIKGCATPIRVYAGPTAGLERAPLDVSAAPLRYAVGEAGA